MGSNSSCISSNKAVVTTGDCKYEVTDEFSAREDKRVRKTLRQKLKRIAALTVITKPKPYRDGPKLEKAERRTEEDMWSVGTSKDSNANDDTEDAPEASSEDESHLVQDEMSQIHLSLGIVPAVDDYLKVGWEIFISPHGVGNIRAYTNINGNPKFDGRCGSGRLGGPQRGDAGWGRPRR